MKKIFCIFLLIGIFLSAKNIDIIIDHAGGNKEQIISIVNELKNSEYEHWGNFLLRNISDADLINMDSNYLFSYFNALNENKNRIKWSKNIDNYLFYHYILPFRVSQEPIERFVQLYSDSLYEIIKYCKNMEQAAMRINEWVYTKMEYKPTRRWDQNAITTIKRGFGRCEEMSILFIKALRTVMIPARIAYTPWWPFTNSNHAWVEVYINGHWKYMGGGELTEPNNTWFSNPTKRTGIILSPVFGDNIGDKEIIYQNNETYSIINSTPNYTKTKELTIIIEDNNKKIEKANVSLCVYNYSSLMPIAKKTTDNNGIAKFIVNPIDYFIYVSKDNQNAYKVINSDYNDTIVLQLNTDTLMNNHFWLYALKIESKHNKSKYKPNIDSLNKLREYHFKNIVIIDSNYINLLQDNQDKKLFDILYKSRGNHKILAEFYSHLSDELKSLFCTALNVLPDKDKVYIDTIQLKEELQAIKLSMEFSNKEINDSISENFIINNRISNETYKHWRYILQNQLMILKDNDLLKTIDNIKKYINEHIEIIDNKNYFTQLKGPVDVLIAKKASEYEIAIFTVGLLRAFGIPSRVYWNNRGFEYFENDKWIYVDFNKHNKEKKENAKICLKFFNQGKDITDNMEYYKNFTLCKFDEYPVLINPDLYNENGYIVIDIIKDKYYLINGFRNAFGDAFIRMNKINITALQETLSFKGGIPIEDIKPGMLFTREYKEPELSILGLKNNILKKGNVLLLFIDMHSEVSKSTLNAMIKIIKTFNGKVLIFIEGDSEKQCSEFMNKYDLDIDFYVFNKKQMKALNIYTLPTTILLKDSIPMLLIEGLFLHSNLLTIF